MLKTFSISVFVLILIIDSTISQTPPDWQNPDISTLRLLQIVHRHGERTVLKDSMPSTDPFKNLSNWYEGYGQLTNAGKYGMYKIGEYIRESYDKYLGSNYSPREVYARSSIEHRCIESVSTLLAGAYPPKNKDWQWDSNVPLATEWQPFPIETFMPKDEDTLLVPHKKCPKVSEEHNRVSDSAVVQKIVSDFQKENISKFLTELFNESIVSLYRGQQFWDTLKIEKERDLIWPQLNSSTFTQDQVIERLKEFSIGSYVHDWDTDLIRRVRIGKLIETLITNMKIIIDDIESDNKYKLYVYSTHDSIIAPLLQTLSIYDNQIPTYGATVLFALHELPVHSKNYSVVIYYFNETLSGQPYKLWEQEFKHFQTDNKKWFYTDFDQLCGIEVADNLILSEMTFMVVGIGIGVALLGLNILALKFIRTRKSKKSFNFEK